MNLFSLLYRELERQGGHKLMIPVLQIGSGSTLPDMQGVWLPGSMLLQGLSILARVPFVHWFTLLLSLFQSQI